MKRIACIISIQLLIAVAAMLFCSIDANAQYAQPAPQTLEIRSGRLTAEGGRTLSDNEVRLLVGDEIFQKTYVGARRQYNAGIALLSGGLAGVGAGIALMVTADNSGVRSDNYYGYDESDGRAALGALLMIAGGACIDVGVPFLIIGKRRLSWIAEDYNMKNSPAYSFNIEGTSNGVGLVIRF
ncbi:MAG: hypothetical protein II693_02230 [Bacteroidales bacterium]|nr:hypothetical protein [Bacteroidales bacterium]